MRIGFKRCLVFLFCVVIMFFIECIIGIETNVQAKKKSSSFLSLLSLLPPSRVISVIPDDPLLQVVHHDGDAKQRSDGNDTRTQPFE